MKRFTFIIIVTINAMIVFGMVPKESNKNSLNKVQLEALIDSLRSECNSKDALLTSQENDIDSLKQLNKLLTDSLADYNFFNNEDTCVFIVSIEQDLGNFLNGKYKTQFDAICKIKKLKQQLLVIETNIYENKNQQNEKGWSQSDLNRRIELDIKKNMYEIGKLIDEINMLDLAFMSSSQKDYYHNLLNRFDSIFNTYF